MADVGNSSSIVDRVGSESTVVVGKDDDSSPGVDEDGEVNEGDSSSAVDEIAVVDEGDSSLVVTLGSSMVDEGGTRRRDEVMGVGEGKKEGEGGSDEACTSRREEDADDEIDSNDEVVNI